MKMVKNTRRFSIEFFGGNWTFHAYRIKDEYLSGFIIGYWFIGWIR